MRKPRFGFFNWLSTFAFQKKRGFRCTSSRGVKDDITNAGGTWVEVVVDRNMISSRSPEDLPAFCREIVEVLSRQPVSA